MRDRSRTQWIVGGAAVVALLYALVVWVRQVVAVLSGCADGFGTPGVTGRLTGDRCVLSGGTPLVELPWHEDMWITGMLAVVLACVLAGMLAPRGSGWARVPLVLAVPVLLYAGLSMGARGYQRADGELLDYAVHGEGSAMGAVPGGWELSVSGRDIVIPDAGVPPIAAGFAGGLALLVLLVPARRPARRP